MRDTSYLNGKFQGKIYRYVQHKNRKCGKRRSKIPHFDSGSLENRAFQKPFRKRKNREILIYNYDR